MLQAVRLLTELARPIENRRYSSGTTTIMDTRQTLSTESSVQFREIYKNGWLRKTDKMDKEISRFWVTFCVHDDSEPRLEGFADQKQATTHSPLWATSLRGIHYVSPTLCATSRHDYEFCINLNDDKVVRLAAPTYEGMLDWVQILTRKLTDMKILRPKENVYSKGPERIATRDPTSPLPPPPPSPIQSTVNNTTSSATVQSPSPREESTDNTQLIFNFESISIDDRINHQSTPIPTPTPTPSASSSSSSQLHRTRSRRRVVPVVPTTSNENEDYESIFMASSYSPDDDIINPSREDNNSTSSNNELSSTGEYAALIEYRSSDTPDIRQRVIQQQQPIERARSSSVNSIARPLTLREKQISKLKREMLHRAGVRLQLGRRDCKDSIAFVDSFGSIWVAGWKQREHPLLYNVLHVGDMVISVAGNVPPSASSIRDILKGITTPRIEMIVRRLPHARAIILTKSNENDDFGLELNGNELSGVSDIALNEGLSPLAEATDPTAPTGSNTTWTLTEVNGKPLNIFDGCANERLRAVGRDISIVVQPTDFVASLRKKLRAIRNYKNFILQ